MVKCFSCPETDRRVLEKHHYWGRKNSDLMVWSCKNCHKKITDEQNKFPRSVRKGTFKHDRSLFALCSSLAFLKVFAEEQLKIVHELANERR